VRQYRFVTLDVFTATRFGGNPLAVFTDARGLSDAEMQSLAREMNLSETTFVLPPDDPANSARVRIFTPATEMPFAGHPNVGTGHVLASERGGDMLRFEEIAGLVTVQVARGADGAVGDVTIAAPQPLTLGTEFTPVQIAGAAGIEPWEVVTENHRPLVASVGNPFAVMEVTPDALTRAVPDSAGMARANGIAPELDGRFRVYLYARDGAHRSARQGATLRARMFGGGLGVKEDAATGSAAAPLAALLLHLSGAETGAWDIVQGVEMGRPSLLKTTATRGPDGIRATVGGGCVRVMEGTAFL
jgi:trans-2,3-dihydro-3-hydroxyanthranilate isomerase